MISKWSRWFAAAAAWLAAVAALADQYNLPEPQSIIARQIYDLHTLIMWIIVGIFVVVFGSMTYAIVKHRKSVGHQAQQIMKFVEALRQAVPCPVETFDERLTTVQGERALLETDASRGKRKRLIDQVAAQLILQSYLDVQAKR